MSAIKVVHLFKMKIIFRKDQFLTLNLIDIYGSK